MCRFSRTQTPNGLRSPGEHFRVLGVGYLDILLRFFVAHNAPQNDKCLYV